MEKIFEEKEFHGKVTFFDTVIHIARNPLGGLFTSGKSFETNLSPSVGGGAGLLNILRSSGSLAEITGNLAALSNTLAFNNPNITIGGFAQWIFADVNSLDFNSAVNIDTGYIGCSRSTINANSVVAHTVGSVKGYLADFNKWAGGLLTITSWYGFYSNPDDKHANTTLTNAWHFYGKGNHPSFFGGTAQADKGFISTAQTVKADDSVTVINQILAGVNSVEVDEALQNSDDYIVLPALLSVPVGHTIKIACNANSAFELRTPDGLGEKINTVNSDGTNEYLCTDTEIITITKINTTDGWIATAQTALGAIATPVVPDNI